MLHGHRWLYRYFTVISRSSINDFRQFHDISFQIKFGKMSSFETAKSYLEKRFAPERKKVLEELEGIKNDIQSVIEILTWGNVVYSSCSLIGGLMMATGIVFTGGAAMIPYGAVLGSYSSVVGVSHATLTNIILIKKLTDAATSLQVHAATCSKMVTFLKLLKEYIDLEMDKTLQSEISTIKDMRYGEIKELGGNVLTILGVALKANEKHTPQQRARKEKEMEIYKLIKMKGNLLKILPGYSNEIAGLCLKGCAMFSKNALIVPILGILVDLQTLFTSLDDSKRFHKGILCDQAKKLDKAISDLKWELEECEKIFKN